jgi:hypothetical protein
MARAEQKRIKATIYEDILRETDRLGSLSDAYDSLAPKYGKTTKAMAHIYYDLGGNKENVHGNAILSKREEALLLGFVLSFSSVNLPLTPMQVKESMKMVTGKEWSESTLYRWIDDQHARVRKRKTKKLTARRCDHWMIKEGAHFCSALEESTDRLLMSAHNCVNYDETRIVMHGGNHIRLERAEKTRAESRGKRPKTIGTLVPFVSADGRVIMTVIIIPAAEVLDKELCEADFYLPDQSYQLRGSHPRFFAVTKSGFMNTPLLHKVMEKFREVWNNLYPGLHCYVFSDQLGSHYSVELVRENLSEGVLLWSLIANTSHFLQPLDDVCFARFKQAIYTMVRDVEFRGILSKVDYTDHLYQGLYDAEQIVFTPRLLKRSFLNTHLFPFCPSSIMKLIEENVGKYSPVKEDLADVASKAMVEVLQVQLLVDETKKRKRRSKISLNGLHDPATLVAYEDQQNFDSAERKRAKRETKQKAEMERMVEAKNRQLNKLLKTCRHPECRSTHRSSKNWAFCFVCKGIFCPKHRTYAKNHGCVRAKREEIQKPQ